MALLSVSWCVAYLTTAHGRLRKHIFQASSIVVFFTAMFELVHIGAKWMEYACLFPKQRFVFVILNFSITYSLSLLLCHRVNIKLTNKK